MKVPEYYVKYYNHGEVPCLGLLLVETLSRHYATTA